MRKIIQGPVWCPTGKCCVTGLFSACLGQQKPQRRQAATFSFLMHHWTVLQPSKCCSGAHVIKFSSCHMEIIVKTCWIYPEVSRRNVCYSNTLEGFKEVRKMQTFQDSWEEKSLLYQAEKQLLWEVRHLVLLICVLPDAFTLLYFLWLMCLN